MGLSELESNRLYGRIIMLEKVRSVEKSISVRQKVIWSAVIFVFGICMGLFSKMLDTAGFNELPQIMQFLDITNFLGRFAIWIFIAVCISVYSISPKRAALNVFLFFIGMVGSYYLYSAFVAGFFPRSYALIWFGITAVSPALAFLCWYSKGSGWFAVVLSGIIIGVLLSQAIFLTQGIRIAKIPEVIVWIASIWVLRRKWKELAIELCISVPVALLIQLFLPYWG